MSTSVGVVGVGIMGSAMARNLLARGFSVSGYDVVEEKAEALLAEGGKRASSPREVAAGSRFVIVSLPSPSSLRDVTTGPDGLPAGAHQDLVVIETSTLPLEAKEDARDALAEARVPLLDCPISGTGAQARERDIILYASGERAAFDRASPVFEAIGRAAYHLGEFGTGSKMKFVANLLVAIHNLAAAEAFVLARKAGLDPRTVLEVISAGAGSSRVFEMRGPMMVDGRYEPPTATIDTFRKDVAIIGSFAAQLGSPTPLLSASLPYYAAASSQGRGDQDTAALCAVLEEMARAPSE